MYCFSFTDDLDYLYFEMVFQVNEEHVGLVMEALSHRRAEVVDMGPVAGSEGRTRISMTCPSRLVLWSYPSYTICFFTSLLNLWYLSSNWLLLHSRVNFVPLSFILFLRLSIFLCFLIVYSVYWNLLVLFWYTSLRLFLWYSIWYLMLFNWPFLWVLLLVLALFHPPSLWDMLLL